VLIRELNKITIRDNFPAELIDDNIDHLKGKKYFTILILKNGFYHIKMYEASIKVTSFVTPLGQYANIVNKILNNFMKLTCPMLS